MPLKLSTHSPLSSPVCLLSGLGLQKGYNRADEVQWLVSMDPVTSIRDILDIRAWKESLNLRVILRAKM